RKVLSAHLHLQIVYYTLATIAVTILVLQVVFSATVVALAADKKDYHVAIEALGAITTVVSFVAGYMKSIGQPTRARQFMEALQHVRDKIDQAYAAYSSGCTGAEDPRVKAKELETMFEQAQLNALANMPDVWVDVNVTTGKLTQPRSLPV